MLPQLTPNKLLILAAIRHLQPCGSMRLASFLGKPKSTIVREIYGCRSVHVGRDYHYSGLIEAGYIAQAPPRIHCVPLRLTEAGKRAIRDVCLIHKDGIYTVGKVTLK